MEPNPYEASQEAAEQRPGEPRDWVPLILTIVNVATLVVVLLVVVALLLPAGQMQP
jgi:hypothetical protein